MKLLDEYKEAMAVHTATEARMWMAKRVREFLNHWQHDGMGWDEARWLICINLAYVAGMHGPDAQERVYQLYGAIHPTVLAMTKEERKGRQFPHEFTDAELRRAANRWVEQATGGRWPSTFREGATV